MKKTHKLAIMLTMLDSSECKKVWDEVIKKVSPKISEFDKGMILPKINLSEIQDETVYFLADSNLAKTSFENKLSKQFTDAFSEVLGKKVTISVECKDTTAPIKTDKSALSTKQKADTKLQEKHSYDSNSVENEKLKTEKIKKRREENPKLKEEYTFDNFVISENNSFAANAAKAISKNPGTAYNPFLIYGGVGLGKTHLMEAIGNEIVEKTNLKVLYVPTEDFMNEFIKCLSENKMQVFKSKYRYVDILLLDDIQFFEKKEQLQNEFFYTFNHLYDTKKQMVFTCDRPPNTLQNLTDRLKSRFEQGLTVDLKPPSFETRCAILRKKMEVNNKKLPQDIIELVARNISSNVRDLNAAFLKLTAYQDMTNKELNIEKAAELLQDSFSDKRQKNFSLDKILKVTANHFEISVSDIRGKSRNKTIALARHIVMFLAHEMTQMSSSEIGSEVGNRTHGTVLHSCDVISNAILSDTSIQTILEQLKNNLQNLPD